MTTSCTTINPNDKCSGAANIMCLTVKNTTSETISVIQNIAPGITPQCFNVGSNSTVLVNVGITTSWKITGLSSKTVYYASLSPQKSAYTVTIQQTPVLTDITQNPLSNFIFIAVLVGVVVLAGFGYSVMKKSIVKSNDYLECAKIQSEATCQMLYPTGTPQKRFIIVCGAVFLVVLLAWAILRGPVGKFIVGQNNITAVNKDQCLKRGGDWRFVMPPKESGFKNVVQRLRCKYGGIDGPCLCYNQTLTNKCAALSTDPNAPKGVHWDDNRANNATDTVCPCCDAGSDCFDLSVENPLGTRC